MTYVAIAFGILSALNVFGLVILYVAEFVGLQVLKRTDAQELRMLAADLRNKARRLVKLARTPGLKRRTQRAALVELVVAILIVLIF